MALIEKLNALGDAVREKAELTEKMTLDQMAEAISNLEVNPAPNVAEITIIENGTYTPDEGVDGFNKVIVDVPIDFGDLPENLLHLTGNQQYKFYGGGWNSFLEKYGNQITTEELTNISYMFAENKDLQNIPFSFNMSKTLSSTFTSAFENANKLEHLPAISNCKLSMNGLRYMFRYCYNLQEIDIDFDSWDITELLNYTSGYEGNFNSYCHSIKEIPMSFYKKVKKERTTAKSSYLYSMYYYLCAYCHNVAEVIGIPVMTMDKYTSNAFNSSFLNAYRLKDFTFETQEDGTPYSAPWKSQTIDLTSVGFYQLSSPYLSKDYYLYNSGITIDKCIYDDATYQALKNDPDSYVCGHSAEQPVHYSRYDKASAIRTINSLPDVSGSGGTNTIKFKGEAGLKTDGGAINTMTAEEIAVATAKGWTVSFT